MTKARSIKQLLSKKGWTGEEIGQALFLNLAHEVKSQGEKVSPLLSDDDLQRMMKSLHSRSDIQAYNSYVYLYGNLVDLYNLGQLNFHRFENGFYRSLYYLSEALKSEEGKLIELRQPYILSEDQYKRLVKEAKDKQRNIPINLIGLLFHELEEVMKAFDNDPKSVPPDMREELEELRNEKITDPEEVKLYIEGSGEGYYSLSDGRRSDQMKNEDWSEALYEGILENFNYFINGEEASKEEKLLKLAEMRQENAFKLFFEGADSVRSAYKRKTGKDLEFEDEQIMRALEAYLEIDGLPSYPEEAYDEVLLTIEPFKNDNGIEWHPYTSLDEVEDGSTLTRYDLLPIYEDLPHPKEIGAVEYDKLRLKRFKAAFPNIFKLLLEAVQSKVKEARGLKTNQFTKNITTFGELADRGISPYSRYIDVEDNFFTLKEVLTEQAQGDYLSKDRRGGIAVIKAGMNFTFNQEGYYIPLETPLLDFFSLETLDPDKEKDNFHYFRDLLTVPGISFIYAYNALIDIVMEVYKLPEETKVIKLTTDNMESKITGYNGLIHYLYCKVIGDRKLKEIKRAKIKELFQPIDLEELKPSTETIENVKDEIRASMYKEPSFKVSGLSAFISELSKGRA